MLYKTEVVIHTYNSSKRNSGKILQKYSQWKELNIQDIFTLQVKIAKVTCPAKIEIFLTGTLL